MSENPIAYAITTKARVKDLIGLDNANHDTNLDRIIGAVTDFLEGECGGRRFKEATYTNELHTIYNIGQKYLQLKNIPVGTVTALQYRAGLKSDPNWTDFATDDWELVNDGASGMIAVIGIPTGVNLIRVSYTGGYKIDFANVGSATHTLPLDLSNLAERLTVKIFKRRENEGKISEAFEGGTVQWDKLLADDFDKGIIARYRRVPQFV